MGPLIGTRLPLYDQLTNRYWTPETRLDWDASFGLRQNADGTQTIYVKFPPAQSSLPYVGGPTGAIVVSNDKNPPEIDIATTVVPQKGLSETIEGKWTFTQPISSQNQAFATFAWRDEGAGPGRGYRVYRAAGPCTPPITFTQIGSSSVPATFFDMTVPSPGVYCYTVRAVVAGVEEANPSTLQVTVDPVQFMMVGE
jgi:hypothetical protein